ncbi:tetratricopeptide repeat protein, partial [Candidatus Omnitrophota bacterium]
LLGKAYWDMGNYEISIKWYKRARKSDQKLKEAAREFRRKIKQFPSDSSNYSGLAWVYIKQGRPGEAIKWYKKAIKADPEDSSSFAGIGWVYYKQGNLERAAEWFRKAIETDPRNDKSYEGLGWVLKDQGRYEEAVALLKQARKKCEDTNGIDELLGRIYTDLKEYDKAESVLTAIVDDGSVEDLAYWGCPFQALGELYSHMPVGGKRQKIIANYIKSAEQETYRDYVQFDTAKACYEYGDYENAKKYVDRAINFADDPSKINDYLLLKGYILVNLKNYEEAEAIFERIAKNGTEVEVLQANVGTGHIEIARKNYPPARQHFEKMLEKDDSHLMANLGMAWISANQNNNKEALFFFDHVLRKNPRNMLALAGKGYALIGLGRLGESKAFLEEALTLYPDNEYILNGLAIANYHLGDLDSSEKEFKSALNQNFTCPYEGLGMIYLKQGKTKEAEKNFKKAIEINPDIEYIKYNGLAKIYIKQKKYNEAKKLLEKSVENFPYDAEARELLKKIESKNE